MPFVIGPTRNTNVWSLLGYCVTFLFDSGLLRKFTLDTGLDIGTADLIIKGVVKVKQGTEPDYFTDKGLVFKDGSSLDADLVVFATGYEPIKNSIRDIFGEEVSSKVTPVWGLDEEGENRRAYTPSGRPGVSLGQARSDDMIY